MEADFVIIGSGSAGSAMASRLSEDGKHSVLVLEYGGTDIGPFIQMPAALSYPMNMGIYDWSYVSEPEPHLGGRRLPCPRGKGPLPLRTTTTSRRGTTTASGGSRSRPRRRTTSTRSSTSSRPASARSGRLTWAWCFAPTRWPP